MKMLPDCRRILLIRRKALGDAVATLPAVVEVLEAWPAARIDLVIDRPFADLFRDLVTGVEVISWPASGSVDWLRRLRAARYDLVIDWLGSPRTAMWTALSGAPLRVGYDLPRRRWAYNVKVPRNRDEDVDLRGFAGEAFLDPIRSLGLAPSPWRSGVVGAAERPEADAGLGGTYLRWRADRLATDRPKVVLVFSATWPAKGWRRDHVADLARGLAEDGWAPLMVTGPGDGELLAGLTGSIPDDWLAPPTSLLELADLLRRVDLFVGTDCGPRHLAAGLGLPTVTLFGPTDPNGWNPPDARHVAVRTGEPCSPCDLTECPVPGHPCMEELTPAQIRRAVGKLTGVEVPGGIDS